LADCADKSLSAGLRASSGIVVRGFKIENASQDGSSLEFERLGVGLDMVGFAHNPAAVRQSIDLEAQNCAGRKRTGALHCRLKQATRRFGCLRTGR